MSQVPLQTSHKSFTASKWSQLTLVVSGRARGLDLCIAEALVEAGGKVYYLDPPPRARRLLR